MGDTIFREIDAVLDAVDGRIAMIEEYRDRLRKDAREARDDWANAYWHKQLRKKIQEFFNLLEDAAWVGED